MQVAIIGMSQDFSFEDGEVINYMNLRLPTGQIIRALVDEETAMVVTKTFVENSEPGTVVVGDEISSYVPAQTAPVPDEQKLPEDQNFNPAVIQDDGAMEFGGDYEDGDEDPQEPALSSLQEQLSKAEDSIAKATPMTGDLTDEQIQEAAKRLASGEPLPEPSWTNGGRGRVAKLQVQKDAAGNPILSGPGVMDMQMLLGGGGEADEDGIGSV